MGAHTKPERSIGHYLGRTVSVVLLLLVIAVSAAAVIVPRLAGAIPLTVLTSSMEPGLPPGTLIVVRPAPIEGIRVGDVVTYQIQSGVPGVISHRVIGINLAANGERTFVMKGDNNSVADPEPIIAAQVQGRLWYSIPYLGFVNTAISADVRLWAVRIGGVLLIVYAVFSITRGLRAQRKARLSESSDRRPIPSNSDESDQPGA